MPSAYNQEFKIGFNSIEYSGFTSPSIKRLSSSTSLVTSTFLPLISW